MSCVGQLGPAGATEEEAGFPPPHARDAGVERGGANRIACSTGLSSSHRSARGIGIFCKRTSASLLHSIDRTPSSGTIKQVDSYERACCWSFRSVRRTPVQDVSHEANMGPSVSLARRIVVKVAFGAATCGEQTPWTM